MHACGNLLISYNWLDLEQVLLSSVGDVSLSPTCSDPGPFHHGHKTIQGLHMLFTCHPGFSLTGSASRLCQGNGDWSGRLSTCFRKTLQRILTL